MPRSTVAAPYDRKSSVTNRSGTTAYFLRSLRISFNAACLLRLDWTSTSRNLALGVDGAPQVNHAPIDFQIDLVKMPDRMRFGTALAQFRCNDRSEMIHPASDCFVRNYNSALREQILDVTKAKGEPEIEPDRLVNDLRREPISGVADFRHALWLPSRRRRDNAIQRPEMADPLVVGRKSQDVSRRRRRALSRVSALVDRRADPAANPSARPYKRHPRHAGRQHWECRV